MIRAGLRLQRVMDAANGDECVASVNLTVDKNILKESREWEDNAAITATVSLDVPAAEPTTVRVDLSGSAVPVAWPTTVHLSAHGKELASYTVSQGETYKGFIATKDGFLIITERSDSTYTIDRVDNGQSTRDIGFEPIDLPGSVNSEAVQNIVYDATIDTFYLVDDSSGTPTSWSLWAFDASTGQKSIHTGFNQHINTDLEMVGAVDGTVFFQEINAMDGRDLLGYRVAGEDLAPNDPNTSSLYIDGFFTGYGHTGSRDVSVYEVGGQAVVSFVDHSSVSPNVKSFNLTGDGGVTQTNNTESFSGSLSFSDGVLYSLDATTGNLESVSERGLLADTILPGLSSYGQNASIIGFDLDSSAGNQLYVKVTPTVSESANDVFILKYTTTTFGGPYSLDPTFGQNGVSREVTDYSASGTGFGSGYVELGGDGAITAKTSNFERIGDYMADHQGPGIAFDATNQSYYVEVNFNTGESTKTFEIELPWGVGAGTDDLINEGNETVELTVNTSNGVTVNDGPVTITIEDGQGMAGLTSVLDTDTSDGGGEADHLSPFKYHFDDMGTESTSDDSFQLRNAEFYNLKYTGPDAQAIRFTIEGIDSFSAAGGLDLFVGGGGSYSFSENDGSPTITTSTTHDATLSPGMQSGDFSLDLLASSQDAVQFKMWVGNDPRYFQLTRSDKLTDSVTFELEALDNGGLSAQVFDSFFNGQFKLTYSDLAYAQTAAHDFDVDVTIDVFDGMSWNTHSTNDENQANFRFYNEGVKAVEAVYDDQFVQVLIDGSSRADIVAGGAAETLSEDWVEWMGHPDPSYFNVEVKVAGVVDNSYQIVDVIQDRSVLVIMNKSLDSAESVSISYQPPTSTNPNDDVIRNVIQTEDGVDALSFQLVAYKSADAAFVADVGEGAVLGYDGRDELDAYVEQDWSWSQDVTITQVDGATFSFDFLPDTNWYVNPNNNESATDLILTDGFVRQLYRAELVAETASVSFSVGDQVSLASLIGPDSKHSVTAWREMIQSKDTLGSTNVNEHLIMSYGGVGGSNFPGYPSNHVTGLNFEMYNQVIAGSKYGDVIGSDFALAPIAVAAGGGDDIVVGSVFTSDILDGGDGIDTVIVYGNSTEYDVTPLSGGGYVIAKTGTVTVLDSSKAYDLDTSAQAYSITGNRDFGADWIDVGTADTLINIEKIMFDDKVINLNPNVPSGTSISVSSSLLSMSAEGEPAITALAGGASSQSNVITTTNLSGKDFGDLIEPTTSGFDYLDLRSLSGDWYVDAATDGFILGDITDAGSAISYNAGSYGDYYDFRGFEGYIISGNSDGSEFRLETADGIDDIVVVDGGRGLHIVLDPAIATTGDVLSFRGTTEGIKMDLSAVDADGYASFDNLANASSTDDGKVFGADYLFGSEASDDFTGYTDAGNILAGYGGADTLTGGDLADVLVGGTGVDTLTGLAGNDVLIDLDDGTLTGGDGKDLFVVRGTNNTGVNTQVADFELGSGGPGIGGGNKTYTDRIAFNFSVASLIDTSLSDVQGDLLSNLDYKTLEDLIFIDVQPNGDETKDFRIKAILRADGQTGTGKSDITLGQVDVVLDSDTRLNAATERLEHRIEDQEDFLASIKSAVRDQMLYNESALSVTGTQTNTDQLLDDTVNLFISLVREDKFAVAGGQGKPVLVALRDGNGNDVGSNFRPGKGNEVIAAGRESDKITIQRDEEMGLADTYGRDTVIERGGDNDQIIMPLSFQDILDNDDLDLSRTQRGREGEGKTLRIEYSDSTPNPDSINDVDLMVYKQYNDYSSSFRVENLTLYNDDGNGGYVETNYDLGTVTATGLETSGGKDAYLVGRENISDQMVIKLNQGEAGIDNILNIVLADVTAEDKVLIEGDGTYQSVADGTHRYEKDADGNIKKDVDGNDVITTDHQVVTFDYGGTTTTINLYFTDYSPSNDEWLLNTV